MTQLVEPVCRSWGYFSGADIARRRRKEGVANA